MSWELAEGPDTSVGLRRGERQGPHHGALDLAHDLRQRLAKKMSMAGRRRRAMDGAPRDRDMQGFRPARFRREQSATS